MSRSRQRRGARWTPTSDRVELHGGAALISLGRAYLANADVVERFRADLPLTVADQDTYYAGGDPATSTCPAYAHARLTAATATA